MQEVRLLPNHPREAFRASAPVRRRPPDYLLRGAAW